MSGTNSAGSGGPNQGAARSTLKQVLLSKRQTTVTDEELDALLANDDIARVTQQLGTAVLNLDMRQTLILERQLCGLIRANPAGGTWPAQGEARSELKRVLLIDRAFGRQASSQNTVTDEEVDDLFANDDIARVAQQLVTARENNDIVRASSLFFQLKGLIRTNSAGAGGPDQGAVRSELKQVLLIDRAFGYQASSQNTVTDEEVDDLFANDDIARVAQELVTASENNDHGRAFPLFSQLKGLIRTNSASASRRDPRAVRSILKVYVEAVRKTPVTNEELDGLLTNDEISRVTQQLDAAFENNEDDQQQILDTQLVGLIRTNLANQGKVRKILKCYVEGVRKTTVSNKELDDLLANDDIARVTQQMVTAITNKEVDQGRALSNQLLDLIQAQRSVRSVLRGFVESLMKITVTNEELDDLLANVDIPKVTQQLKTAVANHEVEQSQVLATQILILIMTNTTLGSRMGQGAAEVLSVLLSGYSLEFPIDTKNCESFIESFIKSFIAQKF